MFPILNFLSNYKKTDVSRICLVIIYNFSFMYILCKNIAKQHERQSSTILTFTRAFKSWKIPEHQMLFLTNLQIKKWDKKPEKIGQNSVTDRNTRIESWKNWSELMNFKLNTFLSNFKIPYPWKHWETV